MHLREILYLCIEATGMLRLPCVWPFGRGFSCAEVEGFSTIASSYAERSQIYTKPGMQPIARGASLRVLRIRKIR